MFHQRSMNERLFKDWLGSHVVLKTKILQFLQSTSRQSSSDFQQLVNSKPISQPQIDTSNSKKKPKSTNIYSSQHFPFIPTKSHRGKIPKSACPFSSPSSDSRRSAPGTSRRRWHLLDCRFTLFACIAAKVPVLFFSKKQEKGLH